MSRPVSKVNTASRVGVYSGRIVVFSRAVVSQSPPQPSTAGKPHRSPRVLWRGLGLTLVLACLVAVALLALPAGAFGAEGGSCPNEALRMEQGVTRLPDCRAYEMVSPPYKAGYLVSPSSLASNGEKAIVMSTGGFADLPGSGEEVESNYYLDVRSADGWRVSPMTEPLSEFVGVPVAGAFEANDGMSLWLGHTPQQSASTGELYVRLASGEYTRIGTLSPTAVSREGEGSDVLATTSLGFDGVSAATSNYQHVVVDSKPGNVPSRWGFDKTKNRDNSLYEYSGMGNERPVLVAATGEKPAGGEYHEELLADCGSVQGSGAGEGSVYNALSADGETVFFTLNPCEPGPETAELYARIHGSAVSPDPAETVNIGESECSEECGGESGKNFEGASENGEVVFFTSTQKLTNNASDLTAGGNAQQKIGCPSSADGCNLYEYDFAQSAHKRLALVAGGVDDVRGVAGIAEDGSRIYFVADGVIPGTGENEFHDGPVSVQPNLYVYDTGTGSTTYITTLSGSEDTSDWGRRFFRPVEVAGGGGRFLLFASDAPGVTPDEHSKTGIAQLFEYDAETRELVRVTQGEDGFNDDGNGVTTGINLFRLGAASLDLGAVLDFKSTTNRLNVSNDGKTVAFETVGELSPLAAPASAVGCTSVYEFHTAGRLSEGRISLISDGRDVPVHTEECGAVLPTGSIMDESGGNILFSTTDSLVPSDVDGGQRDIYDVRVGGGFPPGPVAAPQCESEGCQGAVSSPPESTAPDSLGQAPEAPVFPAGTTPASSVTKKTVKCPKGKKLSHGKCTKMKSKKKTKKANNGRRVK
jgi:hypothetical protein